MVNLNGAEVNSVAEIVEHFRAHGKRFPSTYRVTYALGPDAYAGARIERPAAFRLNAPGLYPWEQLLVAAANCAGSDYPMLAEHYGVDLQRLDITFEADFDPRGEFAGLDPKLPASDGMRHCYLAFRWHARVRSDAPKDVLQRIHDRVLSHNMVLDALRAVPMEGRLVVETPLKEVA